MRLARRNTTLFKYKPFLGLGSDVDDSGFHTGNPVPMYGEYRTMRGTISAPSGSVTQALDGLEGTYTHTLIMDSPKVNIKEDGIITWRGNDYAVTAVRPSINFTLIALRKMAVDHEILTEDEPQGPGPDDDGGDEE